MTKQFAFAAFLAISTAMPLMAQEQVSEEALAIRVASPGVSMNEETGDYTAIELELQGCRLVQTLLTTQGRGDGAPAGVQVLRIDLRDLDPEFGIQPTEDSSTGNRRVILMPSQQAWEQIQQAGGIFSQMRMAATEQGDTENPNAPDGARTLRTMGHRAFSADAANGAFGPVMARTHVMQMRGDRGGLIYPLVAPMQLSLAPEGADAALAVIGALRAGDCAPEAAMSDEESQEE